MATQRVELVLWSQGVTLGKKEEEEGMSSCRSSANKIVVHDQSLGDAPRLFVI